MVCKSQDKNAKRWNQAIEDAKDTIAKCERKIESIKAAIRGFEEARDAGLEYPMQQVHSQSGQEQHAN